MLMNQHSMFVQYSFCFQGETNHIEIVNGGHGIKNQVLQNSSTGKLLQANVIGNNLYL